MKKVRRSLKNNLIKILSCVFAVVLLGIAIIRGTINVVAYEDAGAGDYDTSACTTGICWSLWENGAFWVKVPVSSNGITASQLGFDYIFRNDTIDCYNESKGSGAVYVLSTRLSNGGIAGMVNIDDAMSRGGVNDGDGGSAPGEIQTEAGSHNKFNENADNYWANERQRYSGTGLAYFCADPEPSSSKKTSPPDSGTPKLRCGAYRTREKADTETRIAVQNMSLDGSYDPVDGSGNPVRWKANNNGGLKRSGLNSDSMWSRFSAHVETVAKPGDTVRFYHAVCMAVRYGQWTPTQDSWVDAESHSEEYTPLPSQWAQLYASPDVYIFENKNTWENINRQMENVSVHKNLFSNPGEGGAVDTEERDALSILQPAPKKSIYSCEEASQYFRDPYVRDPAGYQIPGFTSGESCQAASATGISQATGTTISQYHKFIALRMWERNNHLYSGSCGCNVHDAVLHRGVINANTYDEAWEGNGLGYRLDYACDSPTGPNCDCDKWDEYGNCTHYTHYTWPYTKDSFTFQYHSMHEGEDEENEKWATVYIPYNFQTSVNSSINSGDVTFQGGAISSSFNWSVNPRSNNKTSSWSYATSTPGKTIVRMVEWLYKPGDRNVAGSPFTSSDPCSYYSGGQVSGSCKVIDERRGDQNPHGYYSGQSNGASYTRLVPDNDEYIGYKYCVAVGFYPSDSHNFMGNALSLQKSWGYEGAMDAGEYWNISGASCRTIAKKPNFQVWNGSTYTEGSINTSITKKWLDQSIGKNWSGSSTTIFGSWTDYAILSGKGNAVMASGAMLGYENTKDSKTLYDLRATGGQKRSNTSVKKLSPETVSNTTNPTGNSGIDARPSYQVNLLRLESRYKDKAATLISETGHTSGEKVIYATPTGMQVANVTGDVKLSDLKFVGGSYPNKNTLSLSGGVVKGLGDGINDNTLVIVSSGKVTIDKNICYGSCSGDATKLKTYASGTSTRESAKLPQVLIFADGGIEISGGVTRVDAWLITPKSTLSTCAGHNIKNVSARDAKTRAYDNVGGGGTCALTLVINGPVYAKHIDLLRTAGAFHGGGSGDATKALSDGRDRSVGATGDTNDQYKGSITPAEIFNLRADVYIWAYNQAQRYSEAVVTYTRELAPRY